MGRTCSVVLYFLILAREAIASRPLSPAWFSVRLLAWLGAAGAASAAFLTWANLRGFRAVLTELAADRMRQGAVATTICAAVLVALAALRYSFGRRGSRTAAASWWRRWWRRSPFRSGCEGPANCRCRRPARRSQAHDVATPARVRLLVIDGAALGFIRQRVAAGQLPNFGKLFDRGAVIDLATLKPTQAEPVWSAAATGKYPPKTWHPIRRAVPGGR